MIIFRVLVALAMVGFLHPTWGETRPLLSGSTLAAEISRALDTEDLAWTTTGSATLTTESSNSHDGLDALILTSTAVSSLETTVNGPGTLRFWWRLIDQSNNDGALSFAIDGQSAFATSPSTVWRQAIVDVPPGTRRLSWDSASISWSLDEVSFEPSSSVTLAEALDSPGLDWESSSRYSWVPYASADAFDGEDHVAIHAPGERAWLRTFVSGPGLLRFWWKSTPVIDEHSDQDSMVFRVDGSPLLQWKGDVSGEWTEAEIYLTAGRHELRWNQHDRHLGYLDQVSFSPTQTNPFADALDMQANIVATSGNALWQPTTGDEFQDGDALHMPFASLPRGTESAVALPIRGPAKVQWRWRTTATGRYRFQHTNTSGAPILLDSTDWVQSSKTIPAGVTIGRWSPEEAIYGKEAWLDQVIITPTGNGLLEDALDLLPGSQAFSQPTATGWVWDEVGGLDGDAAHASAAPNAQPALSLGVVGPAAVSFHWKRAGEGELAMTNMPFVGKATEEWSRSAFMVGDGNHRFTWQARSANVQALSAYLDQVELVPFISLNEALDSELTFTTGGDYAWQGIPGDHDYASTAAMDVGLVSPFPENRSWLETQVQGPGLLQFNWARMHDPLGESELSLNINGRQTISANADDWETVTAAMGPGIHTLRWNYRATNSNNGTNANTAALDQVRFTPNAVHPANAALDLPNDVLVISSGWEAHELVTADGEDSLQSLKPRAYRAWIQIEVTGPAAVGSWLRGAQVSAAGLQTLPSVTNDTDWSWQDLLLPPGQHFVRWQHSDNGNGWVDGIRIQGPKALTSNLNSALSFTSSGNDSGWLTYALGDSEDERVALSPLLTNTESSWMETTVNGPSELAFDWQTTAAPDEQEQVWVTLDDGQPLGYPKQASERFHLPIPNGQHRVRWTIQASDSGSIGRTVGDVRLENITLISGDTPGGAAEINHPYIERRGALQVDRATFLTSPTSILGHQFHLPVYGPATVRFRWRGAESSEWTVRDELVPPGFHEVLIEGNRSSETNWIDQVEIIPDISLTEALDTNLELETDAETSWRGYQDGNAADGVDMATAHHAEVAPLRGTVTGPGTLSFWRNGGSFQVTGASTTQGIAEDEDWRHHTLTIGTGVHQLTWNSGSLDQVRWESSAAPLANGLDIPVETPLLASGHQPWTVQSEITHDGTDAIRCALEWGSASLTGRFVGSATLSFWWRKSAGDLSITVTSLAGTLDQDTYVRDSDIPRDRPIGGRTQHLISSNDTWEQHAIPLPRGTSRVTWNFQALPGSVVWIDQISLAPLPTLTDAADSNLALSTGKEHPWVGVPARSAPVGNDYVASGEIPTTATSWLRTTIPSKGTLRFRWRVIGEPSTSEDAVHFNVSGEGRRLSRQAGPWNEAAVPFEAGPKVVWWSFDRSSSSGNSMAFIDQINFTPGFDLNQGIDQPDSQIFTSTSGASPRLQTSETHDGIDALAFGTQTSLTTSFHTPGLLTFAYKNDSLSQDMKLIVGTTTRPLPASTHTELDNGWVQAYHLLTEPTSVEWQGDTLSYLDEVQRLSQSNTIISLNQALDTNAFQWIASEDAPWQSLHFGNELDFARVSLAPDASATLETTVSGPGTFSYRWYREGSVSMKLHIGTTTHALTGASHQWLPVHVELPAGHHVLRLEVNGNSSTSSAAWVDQVAFIANRPLVEGLDLPLDQMLIQTGDHTWKQDTVITDNHPDAIRSLGALGSVATYIQGPGTLRYHYRIKDSDVDGLQMTIDGKPVPQQTLPPNSPLEWAQASAHLTEGRHLVRWSYTRQSASRRSSIWLDRVTVSPNASLSEVTDDASLAFTSTSQTPWVGELSSAARDGEDRMIVELTQPEDSASLHTTINGPGVCTFFWRKPGGDDLVVYLDGEIVGWATENLNHWEQGLVSLPAGQHQLTWTYSNTSSFTDGENVAALDQISFLPSSPSPLSQGLDIDGSFHSFGETAWQPHSITTHDGQDAVQSGLGISRLTREVSLTERSVVSFWWNHRYDNTPAEATHGTGSFSSNGLQRAWIEAGPDFSAAETGWQQVILPLAPGKTMLEWQYDPELTESSGTLFLDQLSITPYQRVTLAEASDSSLNFIPDAESPWLGVASPLAADGQDHLMAGEVAPGKSTSVTTKLVGPGSLTFDWLKTSGANGTFSLQLDDQLMALASTTWSRQVLSIPSGEHTVTWKFARSFSNTEPYATGLLDRVSYSNEIHPLVQALDLEQSAALGLGMWISNTSVSRDGSDAAQSGATGLEINSMLSLSVHGPGSVSFWSKITGINRLTAAIDGNTVWTRPASTDWATADINIPSGPHTLSWTYERRSSDPNASHFAWIDDVRLSTQIDRETAIDSNLNLESTQAWESLPSFSASDGRDALYSPNLGGTLEAIIQGPGVLSFWWQNTGSQAFTFSVDDFRIRSLAQSNTWTQVVQKIPAGEHRMQWQAQRNGAAIDQLAFQPLDTLSNYAAWTERRQLTGNAALKKSDSDEDEIDNLLEYAFNLDPSKAKRGLHSLSGIEGHLPKATLESRAAGHCLTIEFIRRRGADINYRPKFSSDLKNWTYATGRTTIINLSDGWERVIICDTTLVPSNGHRFGSVDIEDLAP